MPAGGKVLKGIFKEMLEDYLRVAVKQASPAALDAVKLATRTAGKDAAKNADALVFKLSSRAMKDPELRQEFVRQLARQVDGLKSLPVDDVLRRLDTKALRSGAQAEARRDLSKALTLSQRAAVRDLSPREVAEQLEALGGAVTGNARSDMRALASARADYFASRVNALHEPDLVAGGPDVIGSFGESSVNQSLGAQWGGGLASQLRSYLAGPPARESLDGLRIVLADR